MTEHRFEDAATLSGTRKISDGYLVAEAFAVRTGIQIYSGTEVGLLDRASVRVWRPEDEVTAPESLKTFSHAPITLGHPDRVTPDNWKDLARGEVSTEAQWDGNKIKLPLIIKDAEAIAAIEGGTRELSAGYTCELEFKDGVTPEGEPYDAIQRNIRINHLAIVPKGRAGSECRIGDSADHWGAAPIMKADRKGADMADTLRTIMVDGLSVQTTDAGAQAIEKLTKDLASARKDLTDAQATHKSEIDAKDADLEKLQAKLDAANEKVLDDAALDQRVADRADLLSKAKLVASDIKTDGLSDAAIRKAVVVAKLGDTAVANKADAYIEGRFEGLVEDAEKASQTDPFADALKSGVTNTSDLSVSDKAYAESLTDMGNAWMGEAATKEA